jgi:glycosyltransferase involved in cell wall biosynthesis
MKGRLRLLFLAYSFPPANRVGGIRAFNQAKYLTERGWEVTVVTPHPAVWRSVEREEEVRRVLEASGIRYMLTGHLLRFLSNDSLKGSGSRIAWAVGGVGRRIARMMDVEREAGWVIEAERATAALLAEDVDVIMASGPPFATFRAAEELSRRLGRPYVLDYRDLWSFNPHVRVRRFATMRQERGLLSGAAAIVVVSPGLKESLRERFGVTDRVHVVTNGYDPVDLENVTPLRFGHFAIVYAGVFYPPKRVIHPIMAALSHLDTEGGAGREWAFHYYGAHGRHVAESARMFGVEHRVQLHGPVPRDVALSAVKGAGVSVVITSIEESAPVEDRGIVTGKVFDAIGLRTPLLAVAPAGSDLEVILDCSGLGRRFAGTEVKEMADFLKEAIAGRYPAPRNPEAFAWPLLVERLDDILHSVHEKAVRTRADRSWSDREHAMDERETADSEAGRAEAFGARRERS